MEEQTISVLGCGWLGFPLAERLLKSGYEVKGSTTSKEKLEKLEKAGIKPYEIRLEPEVHPAENQDFFKCYTLIINIPPPKGDNKIEYHSAQIKSILNYAAKGKVRNILFVSSTSVYQNCNCKVTENFKPQPETSNGKALLEAERIFVNNPGFNTTIIRFGGLIGKDRNPVKYLVNKQDQGNEHTPVNLIYIDDCINLIEEIVKQEKWNEIFNASADRHPSRKDYYSIAAVKLGLEVPDQMTDGETEFKIIDSTKIKEALNYQFKYFDPLNFP